MLQAPTGKDVHGISYKKLTTPTTQPVRNHYGPELLLFTNRLLFKITPANFLLHKIKFFFVRPADGFWHSLLIPDCDSLPFPNKLLFAGKIHGLFSKVSRCDGSCSVNLASFCAWTEHGRERSGRTLCIPSS